MDITVAIPLVNHNGDVLAYANVDAADVSALSQWTWRLLNAPSARRYAVRTVQVGGKQQAILMHREIMGLNGKPKGIEVDHIDGDGLNNRRGNLRQTSHAQNLQNRRSATGSTSQYRGVYWDNRRSRWRAAAKLNGQRFDLGSFVSEQEAARVASEWRKQNMPFAVEAA